MSDKFSLLRNTSQLSTFSQTRTKTPIVFYTKINPSNRSAFSSINTSNIQTSRSNIGPGVFNHPTQNGSAELSFIKKSFLFSKNPTYQLNKEDYFYDSDHLVNHIKNKIADIINRKTENRNEPSSSTSNATNINGIADKKEDTKVTLISKVDEIKNLLYNNDREKGKIKEKIDNASKNNVTSFKTKYNLVKDIYPHVDMYENKKLFNKSASCQRIDHMHRVINLELNGKTNQNNKNCNGNNLFHITAEGRIKSKIRQLSNFSIFPDYNARKIDIELKKQYAKNNLNIIGGIKDKFEQNKKEADNEEIEKLQKLKEKLKENEELEEDINVDDLIN